MKGLIGYGFIDGLGVLVMCFVEILGYVGFLRSWRFLGYVGFLWRWIVMVQEAIYVMAVWRGSH
jgi:hypothetical protein